jgi:hypothetical protein
MKEPILYKAIQIRTWDTDQCVDGRWIPARSMRLGELRLTKRIKLAFNVFIGKYDAVDWEEGE